MKTEKQCSLLSAVVYVSGNQVCLALALGAVALQRGGIGMPLHRVSNLLLLLAFPVFEAGGPLGEVRHHSYPGS